MPWPWWTRRWCHPCRFWPGSGDRGRWCDSRQTGPSGCWKTWRGMSLLMSRIHLWVWPGKLVIVPAQAGEGAVLRGLGPECLLHPSRGEHRHIPETRKPKKWIGVSWEIIWIERTDNWTTLFIFPWTPVEMILYVLWCWEKWEMSWLVGGENLKYDYD